MVLKTETDNQGAMPPAYFFELSGEHKVMCAAEAKKCIEAESGDLNVVAEGPGYVIAEMDPACVDPVADRISLTHRIGRHLCSFDPDDTSPVLSVELPPGTFAVRCRRFEARMKDVDSQDLVRKVGGILSKRNDVKLKSPDLEVHMVMSDRVHLFLGEREVDRNALETRKVGERPFFSPISLHPRYARALINLTGAKRGSTVLDPFCGTGGIAIEAAMMGMKAMVSDFDEEMIAGTQENMDFYGLDLHGSAVTDVSGIRDAFGEVDVIATDPPYGRSTHTGGEPIDSIYRRALKAFSETVAENGCAGVILPHRMDVESMRLDAYYEQRVHGSLSRHYHLLRH